MVDAGSIVGGVSGRVGHQAKLPAKQMPPERLLLHSLYPLISASVRHIQSDLVSERDITRSENATDAALKSSREADMSASENAVRERSNYLKVLCP